MAGRTVDPRFGARMRELLAERGLSYRALAARTHYAKSHLHALASGAKAPTPSAARRVDDALGAGGELTGYAVANGDARRRDGWHRPDNEELADALVSRAPDAGNASTLAHEWLITDPPQVYETRAGRRISSATVERVERRVHHMRLIDDHVGGSRTHAMVTAELTSTAMLLRGAAYAERVGRGLLACVADLCQLAGWVSADVGDHGQARRLYLAGLRAGHAGCDPAGAANNLSSLAYLAANVGDPLEGVTLARSAYAGARATATGTTRALLLERVAWAHARAGEPGQAERALGAVDAAYERRRVEDDPLWAYWLTADEIEIMSGRVWTQLRRPLRAIPVLERATARYGDDVPRETALYLTWLAEALTQAREVERAAHAASRALRLAHRAHSPRAHGRVETVRGQLLAIGGAAVEAFEDEYQTLGLPASPGGHQRTL